jgi:uncharacterized repeat protein (TIGR02543 family)
LSKTQVNVNEAVTVSGQLYSPTTTYGQLYTPGIRNEPVKVSFGTPSGTRVDVSATTDAKGKFTVTYTPTAAGDWTAMAWYNGTQISQDGYSYSYLYAYGAELPFKVGTSTASLVISASTGGTTAPAPGTYAENPGTVTLTATPSDGYTFEKWVSGSQEFTDNPLTITVTAGSTYNYQAMFTSAATGIPVEYIYAAVAIIAIVIIVAAAYFLMKRKK